MVLKSPEGSAESPHLDNSILERRLSHVLIVIVVVVVDAVELRLRCDRHHGR